MLNQVTKTMRKLHSYLPLLLCIIIISVICYKYYSSSFNLQLVCVADCSPASSSFSTSSYAGAAAGLSARDIRLLSTVFSFLTSFCFSYYVLDKFTSSPRVSAAQNKYIRILLRQQRFLFLNILIIFLSAFIIYIFSYYSIIPTVYCSSRLRRDENISDVISGAAAKDNSLLPSSATQEEISKESRAASLPSLDEEALCEYYTFQIPKESVDKHLSNAIEATKIAFLPLLKLGRVIPQIGAGTAAGTVGAAVVKASSGFPIAARAALVTGSVALTAAAATAGLNAGASLFKTKTMKLEIKNSSAALAEREDVSSYPRSPFGGLASLASSAGGSGAQPLKQEVIDKVDSSSPGAPSEPTSSLGCAREASEAVKDYINSPLENGDHTSPLQDLLLSSLVLDIISLLLLIIVIIIIFNRYILSFNLNIINKILNKYLPINLRNWFNNKLNTSLDFNNKFVLFMFIFCSLLLIFILCFKIFLTSELFMNINSHIEVHDYYHSKKS